MAQSQQTVEKRQKSNEAENLGANWKCNSKGHRKGN